MTLNDEVRSSLTFDVYDHPRLRTIAGATCMWWFIVYNQIKNLEETLFKYLSQLNKALVLVLPRP
jgi:hypothetical protein